MIAWPWLVLAAWFGALVGVFALALCVMAKRSDEE